MWLSGPRKVHVVRPLAPVPASTARELELSDHRALLVDLATGR
jgi:hypothetical protein